MKAKIDLDVGRKTFASGLLPELIAALRRTQPGDLIAVVGAEKSIATDRAAILQAQFSEGLDLHEAGQA